MTVNESTRREWEKQQSVSFCWWGVSLILQQVGCRLQPSRDNLPTSVAAETAQTHSLICLFCLPNISEGNRVIYLRDAVWMCCEWRWCKIQCCFSQSSLSLLKWERWEWEVLLWGTLAMLYFLVLAVHSDPKVRSEWTWTKAHTDNQKLIFLCYGHLYNYMCHHLLPSIMNISSHYSLTATQCVIRAETRARDRLRDNKNKHIYVYAFLVLWRHKLEEKQLRYQKPM